MEDAFTILSLPLLALLLNEAARVVPFATFFLGILATISSITASNWFRLPKGDHVTAMIADKELFTFAPNSSTLQRPPSLF
mmetsp:Transcript_484/g.1015  ORF Transcript_484/g.1015 Transcript_484/m.1015 type:complete len:81 (-) Transcript_484:1983-2225(-)